MLTKKGVNSTREEKRVRGVAPNKVETPDKEASTSMPVTKTVRCGSCGASFVKECAEEYLCEVMNTQCPRCGEKLR